MDLSHVSFRYLSTTDSPSPSPLPLPRGSVGAPTITSQPVSSIFLCSPLPSGTWRTPGLSNPLCCLPTSFPVCLVFFTYLLTAWVIGGTTDDFTFFYVFYCPLGLGGLQARPFPDVVFPPLFLSILSSSSFYCALQDGFGQT